MIDGLGHDRIAAVTAREITGWREALASRASRTLASGRVHDGICHGEQPVLAHLLALFTRTCSARNSST